MIKLDRLVDSLYPVPAFSVDRGIPVLDSMGVNTEYKAVVPIPAANVSIAISIDHIGEHLYDSDLQTRRQKVAIRFRCLDQLRGSLTSCEG